MRQSFAFGNLPRFFSEIQFSDYKKFTVDTDTTITLPDSSSADGPKLK